jgi:hypothetical protein
MAGEGKATGAVTGAGGSVGQFSGSTGIGVLKTRSTNHEGHCAYPAYTQQVGGSARGAPVCHAIQGARYEAGIAPSPAAPL